jgi:hypothetical protein
LDHRALLFLLLRPFLVCRRRVVINPAWQAAHILGSGSPSPRWEAVTPEMSRLIHFHMPGDVSPGS